MSDGGHPSRLVDAVAAGDDERAREVAATHPELRAERDANGLLPAMHALYRRRRELGDALLPPERELNVFEAAAFGKLDRLRELLDADTELVNAFSPDGFTALHLACFSGGAPAVRLLVERGAPLEALARSSLAQVRPLGTAAFSGDVESARALLEAGAEPNGRAAGGGTPLETAAANGNAELEALLVAFGARRG